MQGDADITVPPGQVLVLGDNRNATVDSRAFGTVPMQDVVGRAHQVWFSRDKGGRALGTAGAGAQVMSRAHREAEKSATIVHRASVSFAPRRHTPHDLTMKTLTRETYARRIERVQEFINRHPDRDLDLARLAEEAHLSPYHFHRVYVAMMGETVADSVRRRRLYAAALQLLSSAAPVRKIALAQGYANVQTFGRAFREAYGVTPAQYRLHGQLSHALQQSRQHPPKDAPMYKLSDVRIVLQPATKVIALQHHGDYQVIGQSFERLMAWAAGRGLLEQPMRCYALYYDDPVSKPKEQLLSEACIAPSDPSRLDALPAGEVRVMSIEAARCATYLFKGPYAELDKPYRWLYDTWLPQSGEELAMTPPYEEYLNDARTTAPAELLTLICLPLKS